MEQHEEQLTIRESESGSGPVMSATLGRAMTTLLDAKPKKLAEAISRLQSPPKIAPLTVSFEQSLWFIHNYIRDSADRGEHLDQVLVPIIQQSFKIREPRRGNQTMILLNWLFQDEILFQAIMKNFAGIILRKDDLHIALGWCIMGRSLIEIENADNNIEANGIKLRCNAMLKILVPCIPHLMSIICSGSVMQGGFELPTRLAVAAADFALSVSVALTKKDLASKNKKKPLSVDAKNQLGTSVQVAGTGKLDSAGRQPSELQSTVDQELLLLNHLNGLIVLVEKITAWSRKSRALHAKGSERIYKWLQELEQHYGCSQDKAEDLETQTTGSLLLSSCWKHYGMLLHMVDSKFSQQYTELLDQYLSGIQFYAEDQTEQGRINKDSRAETMNFFLNCLLLLLGRLSHQQFTNAISEFGSRMSQVLMSQLRSADEEVIDGSISIFKAIIFKTNHILLKCSVDEITQMDSALPVLLNLLDERDATAKAVVNLIAEYCFISSDSNSLRNILKQIDSENVAQRINALDVIGNLIRISSGSANGLSQPIWKNIAQHLLECLKDEDPLIQDQAANLIPMIDPLLVLSDLVGLCYSTNERAHALASRILVSLLTNHKQEPEILCMLLDSLSNLCQTPPPLMSTSGKEAMIDSNRLLMLVPEWAKTVEDWNVIAGPLIDKMLSEPSNAVIVRFLSHISDYLAEAVDTVFSRLVLHMKNQKEFVKGNSVKDEECLFSRLCPLLVVKLLPLKVFDDISSRLVYCELPKDFLVHENGQFSIEGIECISVFLMNRALSKSEFEDVRRLAAELCGRIHPKFLIPVLSSLLEHAAKSKDATRIKVCLFSLCASLMVRGKDTYMHPNLFRIRKSIHNILSWTSADSDEILKAQHGCIDCLALMLCTELQNPQSSKGPRVDKGDDSQSVDTSFKTSALSYVINGLMDEKGTYESTEAAARLPFRLCMANVLISACQKISGSGKKPFVNKLIPAVTRSIGVIEALEVRAACIQILFSVAYHFKLYILPYSNDLLRAAIKSLKGHNQEKMAGAKLLASLMAGEEEVVESISAGLLEARALLEGLTVTDPSPEVRQTCRQLLVCLTSQ